MDEADAADATVEQHLQRALAVRRPTLPAVGQCYSCGEPVEGGARFCDAECSEDFRRVEKARRIGGRVDE